MLIKKGSAAGISLLVLQYFSEQLFYFVKGCFCIWYFSEGLVTGTQQVQFLKFPGEWDLCTYNTWSQILTRLDGGGLVNNKLQFSALLLKKIEW